MSESGVARVSVALRPHEARLVIASLPQFAPYWPADMDELGRTELLVGVRVAMDHVTTSRGSTA